MTDFDGVQSNRQFGEFIVIWEFILARYKRMA